MFFLCFFPTYKIFAKKVEHVPLWHENISLAFPDEKYLAQEGSGKKPEQAKSDALSKMARFFQVSIDDNMIYSLSSVDDGNKVNEKSEVSERTSVTSSVNLSGVECTDSVYVKSEKKYFCVAFFERDYAWKVYEPTRQKEWMVFLDFYEEGKRVFEMDPLVAARYFSKAKDAGDSFLKTLEYGRKINSEREKEYMKDRRTVASVEKLLQDAKNSSLLFMVIDGDVGNIVLRKLEKDFLTNGFIISKNKEESFYLVSIMINQNLDVEDSDLETAMYCCTPDINIDFQKTRGRKTIYSYSKKSEKKIISYVKQNAQKKALDSLVKEIGDDFINELNSMIFGK